MNNPFIKMRGFLSEVTGELKKSSWPTRSELIDSTVIVVVSVLVMGLFIAMADFVFVRIIGILLHAG